jgi:ABC-2 type transport system ATP-binding protein
MSEISIHVEGLGKTYQVAEREPGLMSALRTLVSKRSLEVKAVRGINFNVKRGEIVGFIGPNGAGKTTTLKMLSGLLTPSSGTASVLGFLPWKRQPEFLSRISMVLGNKSQMLWDIPPMDTFNILKEIYRVPKMSYETTLNELVALLDMEKLLTKPVRNMSLGERMKCELVAGLLHKPEVLFLDEPTLGLDISMQSRLRRFLIEYNRQNEVTVLLTSHYMADVLALCPRVILIHQGVLLYDGKLQGLADQLAPYKLIKLAVRHDLGRDTREIALPDGADILERENGRIIIRVNREETTRVTSILLNSLPISDLSIENPPIEAVIDRIYQRNEL